jgi:hypothetical protein
MLILAASDPDPDFEPNPVPNIRIRPDPQNCIAHLIHNTVDIDLYVPVHGKNLLDMLWRICTNFNLGTL